MVNLNLKQLIKCYFIGQFLIWNITSAQQVTVCPTLFDLVFVVDSSGSIKDNNPADGSFDNFNLMLSFMSRLVDFFDISPSLSSGVRVAEVTFANDAVVQFKFQTNKTSLKDDIMNTFYTGGNTNTSGGLRVMLNDVFFKESMGDRLNVSNVALLITDGVPTWDANRTIPDALAAQAKGIKMFTIGVTHAVDENTIRELSSPPHEIDETYWILPNFQALEPLVRSIAQQLCIFNHTDNDTDLAFTANLDSTLPDSTTSKSLTTSTNQINKVDSKLKPVTSVADITTDSNLSGNANNKGLLITSNNNFAKQGTTKSNNLETTKISATETTINNNNNPKTDQTTLGSADLLISSNGEVAVTLSPSTTPLITSTTPTTLSPSTTKLSPSTTPTTLSPSTTTLSSSTTPTTLSPSATSLSPITTTSSPSTTTLSPSNTTLSPSATTLSPSTTTKTTLSSSTTPRTLSPSTTTLSPLSSTTTLSPSTTTTTLSPSATTLSPSTTSKTTLSSSTTTTTLSSSTTPRTLSPSTTTLSQSTTKTTTLSPSTTTTTPFKPSTTTLSPSTTTTTLIPSTTTTAPLKPSTTTLSPSNTTTTLSPSTTTTTTTLSQSTTTPLKPSTTTTLSRASATTTTTISPSTKTSSHSTTATNFKPVSKTTTTPSAQQPATTAQTVDSMTTSNGGVDSVALKPAIPPQTSTTDNALVIGLAVLGCLLLLLFLVLLLLCCCCKQAPAVACCGWCSACCNDCCSTEVHCFCGTLLCCFCFARWLICCCGCCCWWIGKRHGSVSPLLYSNEGTQTDNNKVIIASNLEDISERDMSKQTRKTKPLKPSRPGRDDDTVPICSRCYKELKYCMCRFTVMVPPPQPIMQPVYIPPPPQVQPVPPPPLAQPFPSCRHCYNTNHCNQCCSQCNMQGHCRQCCPECNMPSVHYDRHHDVNRCKICDSPMDGNGRICHNCKSESIQKQASYDRRYDYSRQDDNRRDYQHRSKQTYIREPVATSRKISKSSEVYRVTKEKRNIKESDDNESDELAHAYKEALKKSQEKGLHESDDEASGRKTVMRQSTSRHKKKRSRSSHRDGGYDSHDSCSTHIYMVSDDAKSLRSIVNSPTSEKSYVYLPTDCPEKLQRQMSESLRKDFKTMRATAGK